uniref:Tyrosinase copper-binding domain-containing protein n=1 Tax=Meloidogyne floridensis TaxID=298350 RepID=A0A915NRT3_9BILA
MCLLFIPLITFSLANNIYGQSTVDCNTAPSNDLVSACSAIAKQRKLAAKTENPQNKNELMERFLISELTETAASLDVLSRPELECVTQSCVCSYYGGKTNGSTNDCTLPNGQKVQKALRKEIRLLTEEERNKFFKALREMKNNGDYDYFAAVHRDAAGTGCAHGGQAFAGWHRELTKRFEIMLRKVDPSLSLPCWDATLDNRLNNPRDSILFTDQFFGTTNNEGYVTTGFFAPWETLEGNKYISREVGVLSRCTTEYDVDWTLSQTNVDNVLAYMYPNKGCPYSVNWEWLEYTHARTHKCVGGDMSYLETSANEILFPLFHCFVDSVFEEWRQTKQNRTQRANDYPENLPACSPACHSRNATMTQFPNLKNIEGLRNAYTDNMYEYAARATCDATKDCESEYLFCDRSNDAPICVSKARPGGHCGGFSNGKLNKNKHYIDEDICPLQTTLGFPTALQTTMYADVCYNGTCINNICVALPSTTTPSASEAEVSKAVELEANKITIPGKIVHDDVIVGKDKGASNLTTKKPKSTETFTTTNEFATSELYKLAKTTIDSAKEKIVKEATTFVSNQGSITTSMPTKSEEFTKSDPNRLTNPSLIDDGKATLSTEKMLKEPKIPSKFLSELPTTTKKPSKTKNKKLKKHSLITKKQKKSPSKADKKSLTTPKPTIPTTPPLADKTLQNSEDSPSKLKFSINLNNQMKDFLMIIIGPQKREVNGKK